MPEYVKIRKVRLFHVHPLRGGVAQQWRVLLVIVCATVDAILLVVV